MIKLIKSMLYRTTHDMFFYIAFGLCICASLFTIVTSGMNFENHVRSDHDKNVIVNYEEEDPLNVAKHLVFGSEENLIFHNVPGNDVKYLDSVGNMQMAGVACLYLSVLIFILHLLYEVYFFGELYTNGAIRNLIVADISKQKLFLSSLVINAILLLFFSLTGAVTVVVYILIAGLYPLLYMPALLAFIAAEYLIGLVFSSLVILLVLVLQKPLRALLVVIGCFVFFGTFVNAMPFANPYSSEYKLNNVSWRTFLSEARDHDLGFEWYCPVDTFDVYAVYKADGTPYKNFYSEEPDPDYPGDTMVAIARVVWRLNIGNLTQEFGGFFMYPLYRDGVLYHYMGVAAVYLCLVTAAGCIVVKRRDII